MGGTYPCQNYINYPPPPMRGHDDQEVCKEYKHDIGSDYADQAYSSLKTEFRIFSAYGNNFFRYFFLNLSRSFGLARLRAAEYTVSQNCQEISSIMNVGHVTFARFEYSHDMPDQNRSFQRDLGRCDIFWRWRTS